MREVRAWIAKNGPCASSAGRLMLEALDGLEGKTGLILFVAIWRALVSELCMFRAPYARVFFVEAIDTEAARVASPSVIVVVAFSQYFENAHGIAVHGQVFGCEELRERESRNVVGHSLVG